MQCEIRAAIDEEDYVTILCSGGILDLANSTSPFVARLVRKHEIYFDFNFFLNFGEAILDAEHNCIEVAFESFSECDYLLLENKESLTQMIRIVAFIIQIVQPVFLISRVELLKRCFKFTLLEIKESLSVWSRQVVANGVCITQRPSSSDDKASNVNDELEIIW